MPDYSLKDVKERARASREACATYVEDGLEEYEYRCSIREAKRLPVVAFCGYGRAGKDEAALYAASATELVYGGSPSSTVLPIIAHTLGIPEEQAWAERHEHREFWLHWCHAFREPDFTLLLRLALGRGDTAVGIRGRLELHHAVQNKVIDHVVWIDNPRVPVDPTVEYSAADCDLTLVNGGSLRNYYDKLGKFLRLVLPADAFHKPNKEICA